MKGTAYHKRTGITVKTACFVSWSVISLTVVLSILAMIAGFMISDRYSWPLYVALPVVFIASPGIMIAAFHFAALKWIVWAFLNVPDVRELSRALMLSGFGAYSPASVSGRHPREYAAIMQRFTDYVFEDDDVVPATTHIYNRQPWQSGRIIFLTAVALLCITMLAMADASTAVVLTMVVAVCALAILYKYSNISDRSPQITLSKDGLEIRGTFIPWQAISSWEIRPAKNYRQLTYMTQGKMHKERIDELLISPVQLNHLLHIYHMRAGQS